MRMAKHPRALTLIEAMLLLVIISIVAVAAGVGLQAVAKVPANTDAYMAANNVAVSVLEQTCANLIRNWPSATWGGANYAFIAGGTSYTPTTVTYAISGGNLVETDSRYASSAILVSGVSTFSVQRTATTPTQLNITISSGTTPAVTRSATITCRNF